MKPWRSYIPAILRRYWFWLTVSLLGNALVWLVVFNQTASLPVDAPQSLFGFPISYDASISIAMMLLAGMFFFGLMLLATILYPLFYFLATAGPYAAGRLVCALRLRPPRHARPLPGMW